MAKIECNYDYIPSYMTGRSHSFAHIIIPTSPMLYLRIEDTDYWLNSDSIAFVCPNSFHRLICTERVLWFNIPEEMVVAKDLPFFKANPIFRVTNYMRPLIPLIQYECTVDINSDCLRYLFYYLYSKLVAGNKPRSIQYMEAHYAEPIKISTLAKLENYNTTYYIEWFRNETGTTPSKYLQQVRMDKAKVLLVNTQYRILDIALQVGYNSSASFTRAFKDLVGMTPQQYRKENQVLPGFNQLPYWQIT
jgi:AraC-like DNA-binding protein